jgi:hypothetical protein
MRARSILVCLLLSAGCLVFVIGCGRQDDDATAVGLEGDPSLASYQEDMLSIAFAAA